MNWAQMATSTPPSRFMCGFGLPRGENSALMGNDKKPDPRTPIDAAPDMPAPAPTAISSLGVNVNPLPPENCGFVFSPASTNSMPASSAR